MNTDSEHSQTEALITEVTALRSEIARVNERLNLSPMQTIGRQLLRGVAFGLGSFLGATLVVSFLIYSLASIDFIPILGEWAREISDMIRQP